MNPQRKWINPGFCIGPYLPLYGSGLCILFIIARLEEYSMIQNPIINKIVLFSMMAIFMTVIEFIAGYFSIKLANIRLWDYSNEWANYKGIICPKFSLFWAILGAIYYFLIDPYCLDIIYWLANNLAFSFVIGLFYGIFIIDVVNSSQLITKIKHFAKENEVIVRYEDLKNHIRQKYEEKTKKYHFFKLSLNETNLLEHLKELKETFEDIKKKVR